MKIIVDLPDQTMPEANQIVLGQNVMSTVYAYVGVAPDVVIIEDDEIDDAIEKALLEHGPNYDNQCGCGLLNNMDGDVLHTHRLGVLTAAVSEVISVGPQE